MTRPVHYAWRAMSPHPVSPMRRLARVSYGAAIGLAVGTIVAVAADAAVAPAVGAAIGAVAAVIAGRLWERRR